MIKKIKSVSRLCYLISRSLTGDVKKAKKLEVFLSHQLNFVELREFTDEVKAELNKFNTSTSCKDWKYWTYYKINVNALNDEVLGNKHLKALEKKTLLDILEYVGQIRARQKDLIKIEAFKKGVAVKVILLEKTAKGAKNDK